MAIDDALELARRGDVDRALALLEKSDPSEHVCSVLFMLLSARQRHDDALTLIGRALALATTDLSRSTWTLRRALVLLELGRESEAQRELLAVLKLKASEDHVKQAQASLLATAKLGAVKGPLRGS